MRTCTKSECQFHPDYKRRGNTSVPASRASGPIEDRSSETGKAPQVVVIGEAPGREEIERDRPFVGASGRLLAQICHKIGLETKGWHITNAVCCRPKGNATPSVTVAKTCAGQFLYPTLKAISPRLIVALGSVAWSVIRPPECPTKGITDAHGSFYWSDVWQCYILPTFHPAFALRASGYVPQIERDMAMVRDFLNGTINPADAPQLEWELVDTPEKVVALLERMKSGETWSFDCETTGLNWRTDEITGIAFGFPDRAYFLAPRSGVLDFDSIPMLAEIMGDPNIHKVGHNIKFDVHFIRRWLGIEVRGVVGDTMLAHHLLDENDAHNLKLVASKTLGVPTYDGPVHKAVAEYGWGGVPLEILAPYGAADAYYTGKLHDVLIEQLKIQGLDRLYGNLVMPLSRRITEMESWGVLVDRPMLDQKTTDYENRVEQTKDKLRSCLSAFGIESDLNPNSPDQVTDVLFQKLKIPPPQIGRRIEENSKKATLEHIAVQHQDHTDLIDLILDYRGATKILGTYLRPFATEHLYQDGRVYTEYHLAGTVTGRFSSSDPNMQNIPKDVRMIFCAPDGWKIVAVDVERAELVAWAIYCQDPVLIAALESEDMHLETAAFAYNKPKNQISDKERDAAKHTTFATLFLAEDFTIARRIKRPLAEAARIRARVLGRFAVGAQWIDSIQRAAERDYAVRSFSGRIRRLPDIRSTDNAVCAEAHRQAVNSPIQGLASDLTNLGFIQSMDERDRLMDPHLAKPIIQVHDSIVWEVRDDMVEQTCDIIRQKMQREIRGVKFRVDIQVGQYWGAKE